MGLEPMTSRLTAEVTDNDCITTVSFNCCSENVDNSLKANTLTVMDLNHLKNSPKEISINRSNYLSLHQNCFYLMYL